MEDDIEIIIPPPFWNQKGSLPQGAIYSRPSNIPRDVGADEDLMISKEDGFHVVIDIVHYAPSEIEAKILPDNIIMIRGKHEEKIFGQGSIERSFTRKYIIPVEFSAKNARIEIMSDGFLNIDVTQKV